MGYGSYGNVRTQEADLGPLFGPLELDQEEALLTELVQIDQRLEQLTAEASIVVGFPYSYFELGVFHANLAGGPQHNDAGALWFEIDREHKEGQALRWEVSASIIVFCDRELTGQTAGYSCSHQLLDITSYAFTPRQAIRLLATHIETLASDLRLRTPHEFRGVPHDQLPG